MANIKINHLDNTNDAQSLEAANLLVDLDETEINGVKGGFVIPTYGAGFEL